VPHRTGRLTLHAGKPAGLEEFPHVEIVFVFDRVADSDIHSGSRHPRGRMDWPKVGGVTGCRLASVEGLALVVEALDAIDGTPVLDVKPHMRIRAPQAGQSAIVGYGADVEVLGSASLSNSLPVRR